MKILFLTRLFYPHIGGVEKHVMEVSKRLVKLGHEVVVVTERSSSSSKYKVLSIKYVKVHEIPVDQNRRFKKFQIWWWMWKNRKLIEDAEVVHAHDVGFWYFPFCFLYPQKPFFMTFHGWEEKFPIPFKNKIIRKITEKLARGNICVGDFIPKWYGTKADYITYGGVEILPISKTTNDKIILFIGRLDEQTEIMTYLEAFKKYSTFDSNSKLIILGDGAFRGKAEDFIKKNKLNARILGFASDLEKYLKKAHFVFASGYLSIFEAMVTRRLVFAVYSNPLKEDYLKLTPFAKLIAIEPTPEAMYNRLVYYTQHPGEEEKVVEQAHQWVREQTWEKVVGLYLKLWNVT